MALFLYAPVLTESILELTKALGARRLKKFDGMSFWKEGKRFPLKEGDILVCWGKPIPEIDGVRVLNAGSPTTKIQDYRTLSNIGVQTVPYRNGYYPTYLSRLNKGTNGKDLLEPFSTAPDFCVQKMAFTEEYIIHSFEGRSIRSGKKVVQGGKVIAETEEQWLKHPEKYAHPWVRTVAGGWIVEHDGFKASLLMKKLAAQAVKYLDLTFGSVSMGARAEDGRLYVIGVDRAPSLEGITLNSYVRAIQRWVREEKQEDESPDESPVAPDLIPLRIDGDNMIHDWQVHQPMMGDNIHYQPMPIDGYIPQPVYIPPPPMRPDDVARRNPFPPRRQGRIAAPPRIDQVAWDRVERIINRAAAAPEEDE